MVHCDIDALVGVLLGVRMIRNRLWLLPLWVQGLARGGIYVLPVVGVLMVTAPMFIYRMGWPLTVLSVIALCAVVTAAALCVERPVRRRYLDTLAGLNRSQSLAALEALRTGEVPSDPDVLAAAVRVGAISVGYQRTASRAQRAARWCAPAAAFTFGVVELFRLPALYGGLLIAVGFLGVFRTVVGARRRRRSRSNVHILRAAAGPEVVPDQHEVAAGLPRFRYGLAVAAVVVPVVAFMSLVYVVSMSEPDCYYAGAVMDLVYDQRGLGDPQNMTRGDPALAAYQAWSDKLRTYATQASDPRIAPHLHRIADLSAQAVAEVARSRDAMVFPPADYSLADEQKAFATTMGALFEEEKVLGPLCFRQH